MPKNKNKQQNKSQPNKKRFSVEEGETISACLERMKQAGYQPIRRIEKPIFQENQAGVEPVSQEIIFDAIRIKSEH
ncbi:hypothetical protein Pryu01_02489 [Paraliobacillus ryukyuensis]|uniref:NETI protein n=1 Tax=Paraliobacillus ryukyuensis TaxID=200904 RepID=A0A366DW88_9BACI|nr:NETI motif-containing protein [Paraliobacillus ryukyuensis]RBO93524.1 NETI protein [Paraliobacillus ryukyuensis]